MRITSINDIHRLLDTGAGENYILKHLPVSIDPEYVRKIIAEYRSAKMAIGWDESINWGAGRRMKEEARKRAKELEMEKMKYEARYVFTGDELRKLQEFVMDENGNKIEQKEHFDGEDFEI